MVEENNKQEAAQDGSQAVFRVVGQYAKDISVECSKAVFEEGSDKIGVQLDVGVSARGASQEDMHEVSLRLKAEAKDDAGAVRYIVEVEYVGVFFAQNIPQEQLATILSVDGAAMLFPFARQVVMDAVMQTGYRPGMIEPINFHALYVQAAQQQKEKAS